MKTRPLMLTETEARAAHEGRLSCVVRLVNPQPESQLYCRILDGTWGYEFTGDDWKCPMGTVGGELWVRETHYRTEILADGRPGRVQYRADDMIRDVKGRFYPAVCHAPKWTPSTHMPRWASRTTLRLDSVAVKRVMELTEEEARGTGMPEALRPPEIDTIEAQGLMWQPYLTEFRGVWEDTHGPGSFEANPFVWVAGVRKV